MPPGLKKTKSTVAPDNVQPQKTRLWLMYPPKLIPSPVIWELGRKFKIVTNVRQASVTDEIGVVCLELEGPRGQIKAARVVARETSDERVGLGSKVVLRDLEYNEELDYILVGPGEVDTRNRRISIQSPVGSALKDRTVGSVVEVDIPSGKARYRIERIEHAG